MLSRKEPSQNVSYNEPNLSDPNVISYRIIGSNSKGAPSTNEAIADHGPPTQSGVVLPWFVPNAAADGKHRFARLGGSSELATAMQPGFNFAGRVVDVPSLFEPGWPFPVCPPARQGA